MKQVPKYEFFGGTMTTLRFGIVIINDLYMYVYINEYNYVSMQVHMFICKYVFII